MNKPTPEEVAKQQAEQIEIERARILADFDEIKKIITEEGYDEQTYKKGTQITVDSSFLVKMSALVQGVQQRLEKVNDVVTTTHKYINDMLGLGTLELLDIHNDMARIHIQACEDGNTVSHKELDKEDAKVKVQEKKINAPKTKIITSTGSNS